MVIVRVVEVCVCMCVDGGWSRVGSTPPAAVYGKKEKNNRLFKTAAAVILDVPLTLILILDVLM
jgi:hypothetical protein